MREQTSPADALDAPHTGLTVVRGGALRGTAYLVGVLLSVLTVPLMTRHLGVGDYGQFVTVVSLIGIVAALTDAGLTNLGVREIAARDRHDHGLLRNLLGVRITVTSAGVLGATLFAAVAGYSDVLVVGTALVGVGFFLQQVQRTSTIPLSATLRFGRLTIPELARQLSFAALIVVLVLAGAGLLPFYAMPIAASVVALITTYALMRREAVLVPSFDLKAWRELVREILPYAAATTLAAAYGQVAMIAISLVDTREETGHFALAFRIFQILVGIAAVLSVSTFPVVARAAEQGGARFEYVVKRVFETVFVLGVGAAMLTVVGAPFAVRVIGGPEYESSVAVLRILAFAIVTSFLVLNLGLVLLALRRHAALFAANGAALLAIVGAAAVLIPSRSGEGAALAVLIGEVVLTAAYGVALGRSRSRVRVPARAMLGTLVVACVTAAVALLLPVPSAVALAIAAPLYAGGVAALGLVAPEVRDFLRPLWARRT